jgi:hypothetical protein
MEEHEQLRVEIFRIPESRFLADYKQSESGSAIPVRGLGVVAFSDILGLAVWQKGTVMEFDASYFGVYPAAGKRLAQAAIHRL